MSSPLPALQRYLAHNKHPLPRTLQKDFTQGPLVVLGGGGVFLISEVPLKPEISAAVLHVTNRPLRRLKELLRKKLIERGWRDELKDFCKEVCHPGDHIMANGTSHKCTPLTMLPESGSIP